MMKVAQRKWKSLLMHLFPKYYFTPYWIERFTIGKTGNVIQIGSNDGKADDPLHSLIKKEKGWSVYFVEPVSYLMNQLKKNYAKDQRFTFCNVAINSGKKEMFYWVDPKSKEQLSDLPPHYDKLGSFDKDNITKHLGERIHPYIIEEEIEGLSLDGFLEKYSLSDILLMHVDTEGYDWVILKQLRLNRFKPEVIQFEHKHLSVSDKQETFSFLDSNYFQFRFGQDVLCIKRNRIDELKPRDRKVLMRKRLNGWT